MPSFLKGVPCLALQVVRRGCMACCPGHDPCRIRLNIPAILGRLAQQMALCTPCEFTPGDVHIWQNCCLIRLSSEVSLHTTTVLRHRILPLPKFG